MKKDEILNLSETLFVSYWLTLKKLYPHLPINSDYETNLMGTSNRAKLKKRFSDHKINSGIDAHKFIEEYFNIINRSPWLLGLNENFERQNWNCNIGWLLGPKNMDKVLGNEYAREGFNAIRGKTVTENRPASRNIAAGRKVADNRQAFRARQAGSL